MRNRNNTGLKGINIIGYFEGSFGLGETARLFAETMEFNEIPFTTISADFLAQHHQQENFKRSLDHQFLYPINLFCLDPRHIFPFIAKKGWDCFQHRYNIGLCFWETNIIPKSHRFPWSFLDEIWTTTRYNQEHLSIATTVPVYRIPQPIKLPANLPKDVKDSFGLKNKFTFLFCFCFYSVLGRKNPMAVIKSFQKAFPDREDVQLVIKSQNGEQYPSKLEAILEDIKTDPRIIWLNQRLSSDRRYALMGSCDCYVSLHRSEGFGITMAEAMLMQKPVLATGYSGNLDFMTEENSFLCPFRLIKIGRGHPPYSPKGIWADVDIERAAFWMKHIVDSPEDSKKRAIEGRNFVLKSQGIDAVGERIKDRLEKILLFPIPKKAPLIYKKSLILQKILSCFPFLRTIWNYAKKNLKTIIRKYK